MSTVVDPVCGMTLDSLEAPASYVHEGRIYYFCRTWCWERFARDPERFSGGGLPDGEGIPRFHRSGKRRATPGDGNDPD